MTPEGKVKKAIKAYLDSIHCYYFMPVQTGFGRATVDILVCHKGQFYGIEVKKPDPKNPIPKVTARQDEIMFLIRQAGGIAFATSSVEHVKAMIGPDVV